MSSYPDRVLIVGRCRIKLRVLVTIQGKIYVGSIRKFRFTVDKGTVGRVLEGRIKPLHKSLSRGDRVLVSGGNDRYLVRVKSFSRDAFNGGVGREDVRRWVHVSVAEIGTRSIELLSSQRCERVGYRKYQWSSVSIVGVEDGRPHSLFKT